MTRRMMAVSNIDDIKARNAQVHATQIWEHQAQKDRDYLLKMVALMEQALALALPDMDYDERFRKVHESVVQTMQFRADMDDTEFANVITARALQALEAQMDVPYDQ